MGSVTVTALEAGVAAFRGESAVRMPSALRYLRGFSRRWAIARLQTPKKVARCSQ